MGALTNWASFFVLKRTVDILVHRLDLSGVFRHIRLGSFPA